MSKHTTLFLILSSLLFIAICDNAKGHKVEEKWLKNICQGKEKLTKLHFYVQDAVTGPNATVWEVATSHITSKSPTAFGQIRVLDDPLTSGPDPNSQELGRAQGFITSSDLQVSALNMNLNLYFTFGKYNGSSITVLGRNQVLDVDRELTVVGGTGIFRLARGFVISKTYSYDVGASYGVLEYTIYVVHVDPSDVVVQMMTDVV